MSGRKVLSTIPMDEAARRVFGNDPNRIGMFLEASKASEEHGLISSPIFDGDGQMLVELLIPDKHLQ